MGFSHVVTYGLCRDSARPRCTATGLLGRATQLLRSVPRARDRHTARGIVCAWAGTTGDGRDREALSRQTTHGALSRQKFLFRDKPPVLLCHDINFYIATGLICSQKKKNKKFDPQELDHQTRTI